MNRPLPTTAWQFLSARKMSVFGQKRTFVDPATATHLPPREVAFPGSNDKPIGNGIIDAAAAVSAAAAY